MSFHPNEIARRARVSYGLLALAFLVLLGGFFRTQIVQHEDYALQSRRNRLRPIPLPAPRAIIYDRNGAVIAENLPAYSVSVVTSTMDSLNMILKEISNAVPLTDDQIRAVQRRFRQSGPFRPAVVFPDAPVDVVAVLEEHRADYPQLVIQSVPKRFYPDGAAVAPFVGYTGEITDEELNRPEYEGYKAGQDVGKDGLEKQYEKVIHGREGMLFEEVDARGRVVVSMRNAARRGLPPEMPQRPAPLKTTIDLGLQRYIHDLFADSLQGGALAVDPNTGEVLALYSNPTYDPNKFIGGISSDLLKSLLSDPRRPLYNKVLQGTYPPGSTFKLATAAIAMADGLVTLDEHMPQACYGTYQFGNRTFHCWEPKGHGDVNLSQAIKVSCDVYFYQLGLKVSLARLVAGGDSLGFRDRTGIDLPHESRPSFPQTRDLTREAGANRLVPADALNLAIGQGRNAQTVTNMVRFYSALATDGMVPELHIVPRPVVRKPLLKLTTAQLDGIKLALSAVTTAGGTAASAALQGVTLAGKTGTSQVARGAGATHAWFVGFAPADHPKILVAVLLEFGGHGTRAARIASSIIGHFLGIGPINVQTVDG